MGLMTDIGADEAARRFLEMIDAVVADRSEFTIIQHDKAVARISPVEEGEGSNIKRLLKAHHPDRQWVADLEPVRNLLR